MSMKCIGLSMIQSHLFDVLVRISQETSTKVNMRLALKPNHVLMSATEEILWKFSKYYEDSF